MNAEDERIEPRKYPVECTACGAAFDAYRDTHFVLTEEERPVPDREDMAFDDWFATNYRVCEECGTEFLNGD